MKCPSFQRIIDYLDNRLPEAEASGVAAHLAGDCAVCGENRDWYQRVRLAASDDDSVAPPQWILKRAIRIFEVQRDRPRLRARIGQAIASLVFDSIARQPLAGVRSTEMTNRQLLYRAGDYSIDLQIAPSEASRAELLGQVLSEVEPTFESVAGLKLDISRAGEIVRSAVTNEMGEFKIGGLEQGVYNLRVELSQGSITVPDLPVSDS